MNGLLVAVGVLIVLMLVIHIVFRIIKFTISVFLLGVALIATVYIFQQYFGIDLVAVISRHI